MNARRLLPLLLALALVPSAGARERLGAHAGFEQRMGPGGAAGAMGNAAVADPGAAPAAYWNPAAASVSRRREVSFAGEWRSLDRHGGSAGLSIPIGRRALVSYAVLWRGDSDVKWVDEDDNDAGTLAPLWKTHYLAVGWRLGRNSGVGVTGQWRTWDSDLDGEAWSSPISFGLSWYRQWGPRFSTGVALRDIGLDEGGIARFRQENYGGDGSSDDFYPRTLVVGSRYTTAILSWPFHLELDLVDYHLNMRGLALIDDHDVQARCGAEWEVFGDGRLRAGWDDGNWTLGAGWRLVREKKSFPWSLEVEYHLLWERNDTHFDPWGIGLTWIF